MEEGKEHTHFSAEYLRKYLDGELTGPEMQALEKAALEDPFLSDALEGLEAEPDYRSSLTSDLTDLQQRLSERIRTKNRKKGILLRLPNWQVAAAVLFIVGTVTITYTVINKGTDQTKIAVSTQSDTGTRKSEAAPVPNAADTRNAEKIKATPDLLKTDSAELAYQPAGKEKKSRLQNKKSVNLALTTERATVYSKQKADEPAMDSSPAPEKTSSIAKIADSVSIPQSKNIESVLQGKAAGVAIQSGRDNSGRYVSGVVLNSEGTPIPSAEVKIRGSKNATLTDANGFFRIYLNKENNADDIAIQSVGFESYAGNILRNSDDSNTYHLRQLPNSLNEVVVTGYGTQKRKVITGSVTQVTVVNESQPQGWDSLYHYIETNKKITTVDSVLKGEEVISFVVSKNGELSSFKIIKSVSPAHDAEIIRLIKSGPPLKIKKGRKQKCRISIQFN